MLKIKKRVTNIEYKFGQKKRNEKKYIYIHIYSYIYALMPTKRLVLDSGQKSKQHFYQNNSFGY